MSGLHVTDLEFQVMRDLDAGRDPHRANPGRTRRVSQALGRLLNKHLVDYIYPGPGYHISERGRNFLAAAIDRTWAAS